MNLRNFSRITVVAIMSLGLAACGINSVPAAEETAKAKWADVESAYQRRADLIPNIVETVRAAAQSEEDILTEVIEARASATQVKLNTGDLTDSSKFQQFEQAQGALGQSLGRLLVTVERYPELKSQQGYGDLRSALEGSENRIDTARTRYNEAVRQYNTTIRTFPDTIGANIIHGAEPMEAFSAKPGADDAPKVDLSTDG